MLSIEIYNKDTLPPFLAQDLQPLTNEDSDNQKYFQLLEAGNLQDVPFDFRIAVATKDVDYEIHPLGWASIREWQGIPCIEAYVEPAKRGQRIASALVAMLVADAMPSRENPIGVFSPEMAQITKWLGFGQVVLYQWVNDGWIVKDGNEHADRAGVHAE